MKKIKTLAVSAMVLAMGSMVFANPKSNTKKATVNLFEDGVVDSLKTGVEDNKGFVAVGYGSKAFNAAAGAWLADTFWFGLAYDNKNNLAEQWNNSTAFDYSNSKGTAGEVVDTTTTKTDKVGNPGYWDPTANSGQGALVNTNFANNAETYNNVSVNIGVKGIGGEIYWNNDYAGKKDDSNTVTDTQSTATKTEESSKSTTNTKNNNTWGINFAGLKTAESGDLAFYVGLDKA